jgi:hypothetical protein
MRKFIFALSLAAASLLLAPSKAMAQSCQWNQNPSCFENTYYSIVGPGSFIGRGNISFDSGTQRVNATCNVQSVSPDSHGLGCRVELWAPDGRQIDTGQPWSVGQGYAFNGTSLAKNGSAGTYQAFVTIYQWDIFTYVWLIRENRFPITVYVP